MHTGSSNPHTISHGKRKHVLNVRKSESSTNVKPDHEEKEYLKKTSEILVFNFQHTKNENEFKLRYKFEMENQDKFKKR